MVLQFRRDADGPARLLTRTEKGWSQHQRLPAGLEIRGWELGPDGDTYIATWQAHVLANDLSLLDKQPGETSQQYYDRNPGTPLEILGMLNLPKVIFGPNGNKPLGSTNLAQVEKPE